MLYKNVHIAPSNLFQSPNFQTTSRFQPRHHTIGYWSALAVHHLIPAIHPRLLGRNTLILALFPSRLTVRPKDLTICLKPMRCQLCRTLHEIQPKNALRATLTWGTRLPSLRTGPWWQSVHAIVATLFSIPSLALVSCGSSIHQQSADQPRQTRLSLVNDEISYANLRQTLWMAFATATNITTFPSLRVRTQFGTKHNALVTDPPFLDFSG